MAKFMWSFVNEALGWDGYPKSMEDLLYEWLPRKFGVSFQVDLFCFAGLAWALWNTRNRICIRKDFPNKLLDIVHLGLSYLQKWKL
jgi:hypothetical protein